MARLRPGGLLTCFYCGKRSTTRFQRGLSSFDCTNCDATNYLDENGDITDPPVATETVAPRNAPRSTNPVRGGPGGLSTAPGSGTVSTTPTSSSDPMFCDKCLKNQRLFTASLAQYYSEDPAESESEGPDRDYYKFRRGLETRYPQVCENCAGRVGKAIEKAGYTAKTDHLRKMMDRSRQERTVRRAATPLDWVAAAGRWLWWGGFLLQMLWHTRAMLELLSWQGDDASGMTDPDEAAGFIQLQNILNLLPGQEWLVRNSLIAATLAFAWNPHLVQVVRGFSRHLLGLQQWYAYQAIIIAMRFSFHYMPNTQNVQDSQSRQALLSAHLAIGGTMSLLFFRAFKSVRVDTTPLFASHESTVSPVRNTTAPPSNSDRVLPDGPKSFSDLLSEALDAPGSRADIDSSPQYSRELDPRPRRPARSVRNMDELDMSETPKREESSVYDEMDWTPTQATEEKPLPRAFKKSTAEPGRAFGQAPIHADSGPFWYKVPQAPVNPAQRARNPLSQASLRMNPNPSERGENIFFRNKGNKKEGQNDGAGKNGGVSFRQPQFFANEKDSEEANSLADMFGGSFNMGQREGDTANIEVVNGRGQKEYSRRDESASSTQVTTPRGQFPVVQAGVIAGSMLIWLLTLSSPIPRTAELQLGILALSGLASLSLVLGRTSIGATVTVGEMAALGWVAQETWRLETDAESQGLILLSCMLGHLVWDMMSVK